MNSPWFWGILYADANNPRLIVPNRWRFGWTLNWAHPHAVWVAAWLSGLGMYGPLLLSALVHHQYVATHPLVISWWMLSSLGAGAALCVHAAALSGWRGGRIAGYGGLAFFIGMGFQSVINGSLMLWWGRDRLTAIQILSLAGIGALCQSLGKLLMVEAASGGSLPQNAMGVQLIDAGLWVGVGFALAEIAMISTQVIVMEQPLGSLLGVWERTSSALFHVASSGVLGIALLTRRASYMAFVLLIHVLTDSFSAMSLPSIWTTELLFTLCAVLMSVMFFWLRSQLRDRVV